MDLNLPFASCKIDLRNRERSRKFDYIFRLHNIQLSNARMTTFQSLLSQLNLKQLIPALKQIKSRPTLPYYVLKLSPDTSSVPSDYALTITYSFVNIEKKCLTQLWVPIKVP